ncbi:hypothetical protein ALP99_102122 [Pseudomonas syringae pv. tomato]|uniref:Uncharacterized protein n=1 Tax=Pseudomonas syringae pv. apii TaxID=81036 RepID=A0A3M3R6N8_9PSED|nr:hypothetical protein XJ28_26150 [Pseudomonas syringae pv. tomato]EEB56960.1 hypothetical protein PSPTOT1_3486 [Pseudomonas syringae pv. tomato T1]KPW49125.1 hypothetical protein ALO86_101798 [Pseudomonas syringae pv. berberidis]KPY28876.1 hypothetical protein ALO54_102029 [Pseudomonas syringae pv. philadelphi]QBI61275.1 hypothetical protein EIZ61_07175 [Pseudomonas syringae]RMN40973.1 hypothetical protein ALQ59_102342 [Pseudomonas syringae pv. apii]
MPAEFVLGMRADHIETDHAVHRHRTADGHCKVLLTLIYRDAVAARVVGVGFADVIGTLIIEMTDRIVRYIRAKICAFIR